MFKATPPLQRALRRLKLTTKQASKKYYKGNRVGAMGEHTKHGRYRIDLEKVRTYVVPSLKDFDLTPFIPKNAVKPISNYAGYKYGPMDGDLYLTRWKMAEQERMATGQPRPEYQTEEQKQEDRAALNEIRQRQDMEREDQFRDRQDMEVEEQIRERQEDLELGQESSEKR